MASGLALTVLVLAAGWALLHPTPSPAGATDAGLGTVMKSLAAKGLVQVSTALAESSAIPSYVDAIGTVTPLATVTVKPQVAGVLKQVLYTEGQTVRAGDILAVIDPRPFEMALLQATSTRRRDEAQLDLARATLQRDQSLVHSDAIAQQDVDVQAALVKQLEAAVASDKAGEGLAKLNLEYTRIQAPVSGRVGLRTVDAGNVVNPTDAPGVAVITQLTPIDVVFAIPQEAVPVLQHELSLPQKSGRKPSVSALDRALTKTLGTGVFAAIDNQVDPQTGTVRAKARFANTDGRLFPQEFVNVRLFLEASGEGVGVPESAVRPGPSGDFVYVVGPDLIARVRPVARGQAIAGRVAILGGLKAGERVVTNGADRLRDGASVRVEPPANQVK